jgi:hypothetical protein
METVIIVTVGIIGVGIAGRQLYKIIKGKGACEYCGGSCKNFCGVEKTCTNDIVK